MFLLPIGHKDITVRRLPWVTIGIAAICTSIQFYACAVEARLEPALARTSDDLNELLSSVARECLRKHTCEETEEEDFGASLAAGLREKRLGDSAQQEAFVVLEAELKAGLADYPSTRLGFHPDSFSIIKIFTSMFAHGGFAHLLGNMLFLYLVGVSIEERWGRLRFLLFYLAGGAAATVAYGVVHLGSSVPLVGASGAIAAGMGAFVILFARTQIRFFYVWWFVLIRTGTFSAPAWLVLPFWFLEQLWSLPGETSGADNVGYSAHIGGFVFGAAAALTVRLLGMDQRFRQETDVAAGGWVEDPLIVEATERLNSGDHRGAQAKVAAILQRAPTDPKAHDLAFMLAAHAKNWRAMQRHAIPLCPEWTKVEPQRTLQAFGRITELAAEEHLDPHFLDLALSAASKARDLRTAENILRRLFRAQASQAQLAKALFVVAEIHGAEGHEDLANNLLERLVRDHPTSGAWSDRARLKLTAARPGGERPRA